MRGPTHPIPKAAMTRVPLDDLEGPQDYEAVKPRRGHCRVKEAYVYSTGKSLFKPWHPLGHVWELRLECGRQVDRRPRYVPSEWARRTTTWGGHIRNVNDILPPPKQVRCACGQHSEEKQDDV